eukprot:6251-Amphidinium_carterae.1
MHTMFEIVVATKVAVAQFQFLLLPACIIFMEPFPMSVCYNPLVFAPTRAWRLYGLHLAVYCESLTLLSDGDFSRMVVTSHHCSSCGSEIFRSRPLAGKVRGLSELKAIRNNYALRSPVKFDLGCIT